jgi:hypothetical protein
LAVLTSALGRGNADGPEITDDGTLAEDWVGDTRTRPVTILIRDRETATSHALSAVVSSD